jgi:quercetin dioxygenase-like cupin family protein
MTDPALRRIAPAFSDARGTISDILEREAVNSVTIITSRAGAVRGNHYHRETTQYVFVVQGRLRFTCQKPGGPRRSFVAESGSLVTSEPNDRHAMRALDDAVFIAMSRGPRGGREYESDTFRLEGDEILDRADPSAE